MVKISVVGASGYLGGEILRFLLSHPKINEIVPIARRSAGKPVSSVHKRLYNVWDAEFRELDLDKLDSDMVFFAAPPGEWIDSVVNLLDRGIKVISLGGKYRIGDTEEDRKWYGRFKDDEKLIDERVYGLPELYREKIKKARFVANPGCYPTSAILGIIPLMRFKEKLDLDKVAITSISGTSGGGYDGFYHTELDENILPYKLDNDHRHRPEMEFILSESFGQRVKIGFLPSVANMVRGIESYISVYTELSTEDFLAHYQEYYENEPFMRIMEHTPEVKNVNYTNFCDLTVRFDEHTGRILVISAIDNLVKGGSGQAVQNMNLMLGFDERMGLGGLESLGGCL